MGKGMVNGGWLAFFCRIALLFSCSGLLAGEGFKSLEVPNLSLDEAVVLAVNQNADVLRAIEEIKRTRGLVVEVRAQALPQIGLVGTYTQQDRRLLEGGGAFSQNIPSLGSSAAINQSSADGQTARAQPITAAVVDPAAAAASGSNVAIATGQQPRIQNKTWSVAIQARQLIYSGGQVNSALKVAKFTEDNSYYALRDTVDRVVATVRTQFYDVLRNRSLIRVQEESLRLLEVGVREQRLRLEAGTVPRVNVLRAEVELANVRPELISARNNYLVSQWVLAKTLGIPRDPMNPKRVPFNVVGVLSANDRAVSLNEAFGMAHQRRAFLNIQRQNVLIRKQQIKLELAGYKPTLEANGGYEFRNSRTSESLGDVVDGYFFGFTGNWAIFDGFATAGRVKQARAQLETARIDYEDAVQQVDLEVQEAHARLQQAREVLASQTKNIEVAEETLRLASERFAAGVGTQLEMLDARVARTRAQVTELSARFELNAALADFERVTGAGTLYEEKFKNPLVNPGVKHSFLPPQPSSGKETRP